MNAISARENAAPTPVSATKPDPEIFDALSRSRIPGCADVPVGPGLKVEAPRFAPLADELIPRGPPRAPRDAAGSESRGAASRGVLCALACSSSALIRSATARMWDLSASTPSFWPVAHHLADLLRARVPLRLEPLALGKQASVLFVETDEPIDVDGLASLRQPLAQTIALLAQQTDVEHQSTTRRFDGCT